MRKVTAGQALIGVAVGLGVVAAAAFVRSLAVAPVGAAEPVGRAARLAQTATWEIQDSPTRMTLRGVDFVDADHGWIVGGEGTADEKSVILRTENGGRTWQAVRTPVAQRLEAVSFASRERGWAVGVGGLILHTADGGRSWSQQSSGVTQKLTSVCFVNETTGWITVARHTNILRTTDGGATWQQLELKHAKDLSNGFFLSPQLGWVLGGDGVLLRTGDGGATWEALDYGSNSRMYAVFFVDASRGWIGGNDIRTTGDGGATWSVQTRPPNTVEEIRFDDARQGWAIGDEGMVMHTLDGGATWEREAETLTRAEFFDGEIARDARTGEIHLWVVGTLGTITHRRGPGLEPTATPSPTAPPTATFTPTPTPSPTLTPTPTATPSGPWLQAGDGDRPLVLPRGERLRFTATFGNMPPTTVMTGTLTGPAVFANQARSFSANVTTSGGAGAFPVVVLAEDGAVPGEGFGVTLSMEEVEATRAGVIAWQDFLPLAY